MTGQDCILGAGVTGLAVGWASGLPVYEAGQVPGGLCSSYYVRPNGSARLPTPPSDLEAYRFELGGGHWIFGKENGAIGLMKSVVTMRQYRRRASVFFPDEERYVPYPIQNHLRYLDRQTAARALREIRGRRGGEPRTMAEWIEQNFGPTLTGLFFGPFHERYTAGLCATIGPQDAYKSPIDLSAVERGFTSATPQAGYNATFLYPEDGLDALVRGLAERCSVSYGNPAEQVDLNKRELVFRNGLAKRYGLLVSSIPLHRMAQIAGLQLDEESDPYTSVLVLNVGAIRGRKCPSDHWIYVSRSRAGFYRVGFYSNVDAGFLPRKTEGSAERVSIYVERAYPGMLRPTEQEILDYARSAVRELRDWGFIDQVEVLDHTWIETAYTWSRPKSRWRQKALRLLESQDVLMVGRYGRWVFQGIAESIQEGLRTGAALRRCSARDHDMGERDPLPD